MQSLKHWTTREVLVVIFYYYLQFDPAQLLHLHFLICKIEIIMPVSMDRSRLNEVVLRELPVQDRTHSRGSISCPSFEAPSLTPLLSRVLGVSPLTPAGGTVLIGENTCLPACKPQRPGLWFLFPGAFSSTAHSLAPCGTLENMQASTD